MWRPSVANSPSSPPSAGSPSDDGAEADAQAHRIPAWAPFLFADYRLFWFGSVAAVFTNQLLILVTGYWLYVTTGSSAQLGLIGVVQLVVQVHDLQLGAQVDHVVVLGGLPVAGGGDEHFQILAHALLADELAQRLRPDGLLPPALGIDQAFGSLAHRAPSLAWADSSRSARRTSSQRTQASAQVSE